MLNKKGGQVKRAEALQVQGAGTQEQEDFKWRSDKTRMLFRSIARNAVRRVTGEEHQEQGAG